MPCNDGGVSYGSEDYKEYWYREFEHNSPLAEAFCEVMQQLHIESIYVQNQYARRWWIAHKERDKKKLEAELSEKKRKVDKQKALEKLSPYERHLLGI